MRAGRRARLPIAVVVLATLAAGCSHASGQQATLAAVAAPSTSAVTSGASSTSAATTTTPATTTPPAATRPAPAVPTVPEATVAPPARRVFEQAWTPFATAGSVTLRHPASRVELIGFHQSNLDGARQLEPLPTSAPTVTLEGRERDTGNRTAADVMVDPDIEIRAPVTGTVLYAGTYVLYCQYSDDFLVIEPDDHPGWEVKVLHIDGVRVRPGARVQAGQTVIAPHATRLPFESQVEKTAARPAWPHVHIEVDDPSIPDRPTGGGC